MRHSTYFTSHPLLGLLAAACLLTGRSPAGPVGLLVLAQTTPVPSPAKAITEPTFEPTASYYPTGTSIPTINMTFVPTASLMPTPKTEVPTASFYPTEAGVVDDFTPSTNVPSPASSSLTCGVCTDGATLGTPDRVIPPLAGDAITCGQLDATLRAVDTTSGSDPIGTCLTALNSINPILHFLDLSAFCGCSEAQPPQYCDFCQEGQVLPDDKQQTQVNVPGFGIVTCEQGETSTEYVVNASACKEWNIALVTACCADGTNASTPLPGPPTPPSPPTSPVPTSHATAPARNLWSSVLGATLILGWVRGAALLGDLFV